VVSGNGIIQATRRIIHSCIRSEMFVNQAIKLFEQKYLEDISEVICVSKVHEKLVFDSAAWGYSETGQPKALTNRSSMV